MTILSASACNIFRVVNEREVRRENIACLPEFLATEDLVTIQCMDHCKVLFE
jgi:hypothetical protein